MTSPTNTKKALIGILGLPIIVLMIVFFCLGVVNKTKTPALTQEQKERPLELSQDVFSGANLDLEDFTFTEYTKTDNGAQKSFELCGRKLQTKNPKLGIFRIAIGKVMELEKPKITFYKAQLQVSTASSKRAAINSLNKGIDFYGDVDMLTEEKRTLTCDRLKWNNEQRYLLAEGDCILSSAGKVTKAEAIKTDIELKNFDVVSKNRGLLKTAVELFKEGGRK